MHVISLQERTLSRKAASLLHLADHFRKCLELVRRGRQVGIVLGVAAQTRSRISGNKHNPSTVLLAHWCFTVFVSLRLFLRSLRSRKTDQSATTSTPRLHSTKNV